MIAMGGYEDAAEEEDPYGDSLVAPGRRGKNAMYTTASSEIPPPTL